MPTNAVLQITIIIVHSQLRDIFLHGVLVESGSVVDEVDLESTNNFSAHGAPSVGKVNRLKC